MNRILLFLFSFTLLFAACQDNFDEFNPTGDPIPVDPTLSYVSGDVSGLILNENGEPAEGVVVRTGAEVTTTDENGLFLFRDVELREDQAYLTASAAGYFQGSRTFLPKENERSQVIIKLIPRPAADVVSGTDGGTVNVANGGTIEFPTGAFVDANGTAYTGSVNVFAFWLDPTSSDLQQTMPGALWGTNEANEETILASYGMMNVELTDNSGNALQIAPDKLVEMRFPVPAELRATAPATIPLWSFNEDTGVWEEEFTAVFDADQYIGSVSHFTWWNCDAPFPVIELCGTVVNATGDSLANAYVCIEAPNLGVYSCAYVYGDGEICGKVPANEELIVTVSNAQCPTGSFEITIGPFSEDFVLTTPIVVTDTGTDAVTATFTGQLTDCDGNPLSEGYAVFEDNGIVAAYAYADDAGMISQSLIVCADEAVTVTVYNPADLEESTPQQFVVTDAGTVNIGTIATCDPADEYLILNINDTITNFLQLDGGLEGDQYFALFTQDSTGGNNNAVNIFHDAPNAPGSYDIYSSANPAGQEGFYYGNYSNFNFSSGTLTNTILSVEPLPDGYIEGVFNGTVELTNDPGVPVNISGSYRFLRDY